MEFSATFFLESDSKNTADAGIPIVKYTIFPCRYIHSRTSLGMDKALQGIFSKLVLNQQEYRKMVLQ